MPFDEQMFAPRDPKRGAKSETAPASPEPLFRPIAEGEPVPLDALPSQIRDGAIGAQGRTQAPIALCMQSAIAPASLGAGKLADVRLHTGQTRPLACYFATVAASGERKSSTDSELGGALRDFEERARRDHPEQEHEYQIRFEAWETAKKEAHKRLRRDRTALEEALRIIGPAPLPPLVPIVTVGGDPTPEGLGLLLRRGYGFAGVFSAEGGTFVGSHAMSPDHKIRTAAMLSSLWDGEPLRRSRIGDGNSVATNRRVAMHLMVQPDVAATFLGDRTLLDQGLLSRFLIAAPPSAMGTRFGSRTAETEAALARFNTAAGDLWAQPVRYLEHERGALDLRTLALEADAAEAVEAFARWTETHLGENGAFRPISGFANKMAEHATRLAAVFALIADPEAVTVSGEDMARAIAFARWYGGEALRLFDQGRIPPELQSAERVRAWLVTDWAEPSVSLPDLYQRGPREIRTAEKARKVVAVLEDRGWLTRLKEGATIGETFRREAWTINRGPAS
jgi:hypothetical protein